MSVSERAEAILERISQSSSPVSGSILSQEFGVSRQIIVKDIAALKAQGNDIIATTKGYMLHRIPMPERVFKVVHRDDEIQQELQAIVDAGGIVRDVFVWHKIYGKIEGELDIRTHEDITEYINSLKTGRSSPLKNVTNEYHYHTVAAESDAALDRVRGELDRIGFLVKDEEGIS
ncbi:MAG: 3H domain-containing protein [Candidatus Ornithomonoglobus sp.]